MSAWKPFGERRREARPRIYPLPVAEPITPQGGPDQILVVVWLVNRCPSCQSREIRTRKTTHVGQVTVRFHACRGCGVYWKSVDDVAATP